MVKVTEQELRAYVEHFLATYQETALLVEKDDRLLLARMSALPATVTGIISITYGIAIEYVPAHQMSIVTRTGFRSIQHLLLHAPSRLQRQPAIMSVVDAENTTIQDCSFNGGFPFRIRGQYTSLRILNVRCEAQGWSKAIQFAEVFGNSDASFWTLEQATARAKDEILLAVLDTQRADRRQVSIADYVGQFKATTVLILGSYSAGGEQRLRTIAGCVARHGYDPILLEDIPERPEMSLRQKLATVASVSRFIIVEDTEPSGHLFELPSLLNEGWITVIMRRSGSSSTFMTRGTQIFSTVVKETEYTLESLPDTVAEAVAWAEQRITDVSCRLKGTYPWRTAS